MRESIICIGKVGETPYRFPDTGVSVSSYEEICYYLSEHMLCYLYTLPDEELLYYMRDALGLEKLFRQLIRLSDPSRDQMKYFSALFREGNYFSEDEIHQILDEYRELKNTPYPLQCKWTGDLYLKAGRTSVALHYYDEALKQNDFSKEEVGIVYHNRGLAKARLFRFREANMDFLKAYEYAGDEESLFCYYCVNALTGGPEKAKEELQHFKVSALVEETYENRFDAMNDVFGYSSAAAKKQKIAYMLERGKTAEAEEMYRKFIRELQQDFRREIETEENLMRMNVPLSE